MRACLLFFFASLAVQDGGAKPRDISTILKSIRKGKDLPGIVGAIVTSAGIVAIGADGVRRRGADEKVTAGDRFHIGSCAKSMTATVLAMLVEEKKLAWDTKVAEVFSDVPDVHEGWNVVALKHLLTHRGGAPEDLLAGGLWESLLKRQGTPAEERARLARAVLKKEPIAAPGTTFLYSNAGYALAGAMAEKTTGQAWEDLLRKRLFEPLGMTSAGFGAPGAPDKLDQPRGHKPNGEPVEPGPQADNPPALSPAGTVHCSIGDWAKFVALHLRVGKGTPALLKPGSFAALHHPPEGADYAMGWIATPREWAGGEALTHAGSNTMWFAVVWMAPKKDVAVLIATNSGEEKAAGACDAAASALIREQFQGK
ncbi:MAG: beta-lactamase family protein [Planctomycetes bacterium]|nr:beta-lactamase family protein [Planctomycetota bacterium]